ncbi:putative ribosomal large chain pseudouridine synthase B [Candidatus Protochlamydia naegleriophila]|uniref:Pseudouridine synthase n=1 Tax=Candidatus Protochlamydia naegleriophila TaxID=389348 RepID=A0A0U5JAU5_9BACT|nr:pseudouridine synthase [Candidatus Protochlamydia naegleriophila]CUI15794.1 putative ribosomal large chain pseudouridine synthase B [Candidatus Protochlamydia naegleriophila]
MEKNRLSKILAAAGVASRRACEELIFEGHVKVNGQVVLVPQTLVNAETDLITVRDQPINKKEDKVYYLLNKPAGYICSARKTGQAKLVLDLFQDEGHRLFTVGRLDKDTQGLLIVTNDGHFANEVIHPSANIQKEYLAKTDQEISHEHLIAITNGTLVEGAFVKPIKVQKVRRGTLKIVIGEGKKREVRLLLNAAGLKVQELTRIRLGGLHLGPLPLGSWRPLTEIEKKLIFAQ